LGGLLGGQHPDRIRPVDSSGKPYHGKVTENYFRISRYTNFALLVEGNIQSDGPGSIIDITIAIESGTRVGGLLILAYSVVVSCDISVLTDFVTNPGTTTLSSIFAQIIQLSSIFFIYGTVLLLYHYEVIRAKSFLGKLWLGKFDSY
jgi:hypothetical protein